MNSSMELSNKFKSALDYFSNPGSSHNAGDQKICYLTYDPANSIMVKRQMASMISLAKGYNYDCSILSLAVIVNDFFRTNKRRDNWLSFADVEDYSEVIEFYGDLGSIIVENHIIETEILKQQEAIKDWAKPLLIITDLEALHPFTRFGPVEQNIYLDIVIPVLVLYPGRLSGSSLEFLNFCPPDGNYRSKHF